MNIRSQYPGEGIDVLWVFGVVLKKVVEFKKSIVVPLLCSSLLLASCVNTADTDSILERG